MPFIPIEQMRTRVDVARQESDTSEFLSLLYFGEMVQKLTAAGMVAAVREDRERHRYRQIYTLVRADGLGDWGRAIDDVITGPASQFLSAAARTEQNELMQRCKAKSWQHDSVELLVSCLRQFDPDRELVPAKVELRKWFPLFAELRNKTRGHGAPPGIKCSRLCIPLAKSINLICDNFHLFRRSWVFLNRNLSHTYRVTRLSDSSAPFDYLKIDGSPTLENGVYVHFDAHSRVELMSSNPEASDFLFPNGGFSDRRFELISYFTGNRDHGNADTYQIPATELPPSETQGIGVLDCQGSACFGNLPASPAQYISRRELEQELFEKLTDDRRSVVIAKGAGGIGKTSLALNVLHRIAQTERFEIIVWFSARDIDLLNQGPKHVTPQVLTEDDVAKEFARLMMPAAAMSPGFKAAKYLSDCLSGSPTNRPILFVFDNFETVRSPGSLFAWLDEFIRLPNKIFITTRFSDFKGAYPIEVLGMSNEESTNLIRETAYRLGIHKLVTAEYSQSLCRESRGHPYILKILLGEFANAGRPQDVERVIATRDDILDALFERTYARLTPPGKHVFLTISGWRSMVPQLGVEAVLLRPQTEGFDVEAAIGEVQRSSLIEAITAQDGSVFLSVPLAAAVFGRRKLLVSPQRSSVEANMEILRFFGTAHPSDLHRGVEPRIKTLFSQIASRVRTNGQELGRYLPVLEFIAGKFPPAWMLLARLFEETPMDNGRERAKEAIRRYLEATPRSDEQRDAWKKLAEYCFRTGDGLGEMHAQVELCEIPGVTFAEISNAANRLNSLFTEYQILDFDERNILVARLASLMEARIDEGNATDCSRLAWLYLKLRDEVKARAIVDRGLQAEPLNDYCRRLQARLDNPQV
jgi:hypothetical protein